MKGAKTAADCLDVAVRRRSRPYVVNCNAITGNRLDAEIDADFPTLPERLPDPAPYGLVLSAGTPADMKEHTAGMARADGLLIA